MLGVLVLVGLAAGMLPACAPRQGGWSFPEAETWRRSNLRAGRRALAFANAPDGQAGSRSRPPAGPVVDPVARGLFVRNCATCHGIDGSGQGPSVLDRPARNFKDGGFSFGNTADAIFNTISYGIPGTPMPAFDQALGERERQQLANFVRTLGPPVEDVAAADTIMTVTDTPLIVRGILPPILEGTPIRPRGLLIGLPGVEGAGLTFEYRIDDVRLLGVRQGGFVERTDWGGRGGSPLKPLGGLIWVDAGGDPPATFTATSGLKTSQQLIATSGNTLDWRLVTENGIALADVEEQLYTSQRGSLSGFAQSMSVTAGGQPMYLTLNLRIAVPPGSDLVASVGPPVAHDGDSKLSGKTWHVFHRPDGVYECIGILTAEGTFDGPPELSESGDTIVAIKVVPRGSEKPPHLTVKLRLVVHRLFGTEWNEAVRAQLQEQRN